MPSRSHRDGRLNRRRFRLFSTAHMREVAGLRWEALRQRYSGLPRGWQRYEVPFWMSPESRPIASYAGIRLTASSSDPAWKILYTEDMQIAWAEALHWARRGRLPAMSAAEEIGVKHMCYGDEHHIQELEGILREIKVIKWERVPRDFGNVPEVNHFGTLGICPPRPGCLVYLAYRCHVHWRGRRGLPLGGDCRSQCHPRRLLEGFVDGSSR